MSDMNFKVNLLPNSNDSYTLGTEELKWRIYGRNYGTISHAKDLTTKEYSDAIVKISTVQPTESQNKIWIKELQAGVPVEIPTVDEALALGILDAQPGQKIQIKSVDSLGQPTAWEIVGNESNVSLNIMNAEPGQTIMVDEVDENGSPLSWSLGESLDTKLDIQQDIADAGKFLYINDSGVITAIDIEEWAGGYY